MDRRDFLKSSLIDAGLLPLLTWEEAKAFSLDAELMPEDLELPPKDAQVFNLTCQYCMVQCGYKAYVWEQRELILQPYLGNGSILTL
ncbi:MAG: hypothetical protein ACK4VK_03290 [Aquificaceae bacterium]